LSGGLVVHNRSGRKQWQVWRWKVQDVNIELNTHVPHSARIYDYLLGGKDNFTADRDAAAAIIKDCPNRSYSASVSVLLLVTG
jgi:hypothetical protein